MCKNVHKSNIAAKREKIYSESMLQTRDTTFTDKMVLTNVHETTQSSTLESPAGPTTLEGDTNDANNVDLHVSLSKRDSMASEDKLNEELKARIANFKRNKINQLIKFVFPFVKELIFLILLFMCSSFWPSLLSIPYFMFFLMLLTKWSLSSKIHDTKFQLSLKIILLFYLALHILVIYLYQIQIFQLALPNTEFVARILGLNYIVYTKCEQPAHFYLNQDIEWMQIVYPFILFFLYWFISIYFTYNNISLNENSKESDKNRPKIEITEALYQVRTIFIIFVG